MAEGTGGMTEVDAPAPHDLGPIEAEIKRRRGDLTTLVAELNRRGHELAGQLGRLPAGAL